jgi:hypothetical protein
MKLKKFADWVNENAIINKTSIDNTGGYIYPPVVGEDDDDDVKGESNYMFFSNLERIKELSEMILKMDRSTLDSLLNQGHDWANDHVTTAKTNLDHVFGFFNNEMEFNKKSDTFMSESVHDTSQFNRQYTMDPTWWSAWRLENEKENDLEIEQDSFTKTYEVKDKDGKVMFVFDYKRSKIYTNETPDTFVLKQEFSPDDMKKAKEESDKITKDISGGEDKEEGEGDPDAAPTDTENKEEE